MAAHFAACPPEPRHLLQQCPVPLLPAIRLLSAGLELSPPTAAAQKDGWQLLRLEVPLAAPGPQVQLLLDWLSSQRELLPRVCASE
ncbi:unnamed protein product [Effrenium voratum]|nr:unnamed protein product [Effrenium voratum]